MDRLDEAASGERGWSQAVIFEILKIAGRLPSHHMEQAFCSYAETHGALHRHVAERLVRWFSEDLEDVERNAVVSSAHKALLILNEGHWHQTLNAKSPFPFLIFPLVIWRFQNEESMVSQQVFAQGIKYLFDQRANDSLRGDLSDSLRIIESLLSKVSKHLLRAALQTGIEVPDPAARAIIRLIHALALASEKQTLPAADV